MLLVTRVVPTEPVISATHPNAIMPGKMLLESWWKYSTRWPTTMSSMPRIGTPEVTIQVSCMRTRTGGSRVESANPWAKAFAAIGRTSSSASRYVSNTTIAPPRIVASATTNASREDVDAATTVTMDTPISHTTAHSTAWYTGILSTRLRTIFGSCSSGLCCHRSTGRNSRSVTATPANTASTTYTIPAIRR